MYPHDRKSFRASVKYEPEEILSRFFYLSSKKREKEFLTPEKVAEMLGKSRRTIIDWLHYDKVVGIKIGERKQYVYWPSVVEYLRWLQDKELAAEDAD